MSLFLVYFTHLAASTLVRRYAGRAGFLLKRKKKDAHDSIAQRLDPIRHVAAVVRFILLTCFISISGRTAR